ncbi:MAG: hypothetical protein IPL92_15780 [Saprospiraceae bacterium]|nr:hypothetical protein [Candidatus Opimibacter iunctus]
MTLLVSWIGLDSKKDGNKPSSLYIASDSRISWGNLAHFDFGRKVFGCKNSSDIFGYCGDVLFPTIVLNQIIDAADQGLLFKPDWDCKQKFQTVIDKLIQSFNKYPKEVSGITADTLEIIYASRDDDKKFFCQKMKWTKAINKWASEEVEFSGYSDKLFVIGSGRQEFLEKFDLHWQSENSRTSRAVFHSFCDTLTGIKDKHCGGAPQLVGLYRSFNARFYGIIKGKKRYFNGMEISNLTNFNNIEWRNELFEVCDGDTMEIKQNAQRQPNALRH